MDETIDVKIEIGKFYKSNWYTKEEPAWGYFYVIKSCTEHEGRGVYSYRVNNMGYLVDEVNPWGGHFIHWRSDEEITRRIKGNCMEIPALIAAKYLLRGYVKER